MRTLQRGNAIQIAGRCPVPRVRGAGAGAGWACGWLAFVLLGAGLPGGCGDSKGTSIARLTPRGVPYLEGVPVPGGFTLVTEEVLDRESGGMRMASHKYRGRADLHAVRNFYREQMPLMGWNRVSDQNVKGIITIRFEKQEEDCTVEIQSAGGLNQTEITVEVFPFNRTPLEPPKQPVP